MVYIPIFRWKKGRSVDHIVLQLYTKKMGLYSFRGDKCAGIWNQTPFGSGRSAFCSPGYGPPLWRCDPGCPEQDQCQELYGNVLPGFPPPPACDLPVQRGRAGGFPPGCAKLPGEVNMATMPGFRHFKHRPGNTRGGFFSPFGRKMK